MALALGALYHASGGSLRGAAAIERQSRALILAQSLLALHAESATLPTAYQGVAGEGEFRWRVGIEPYPLTLDPMPPVRLLRVFTEVEWDGGAQSRSIGLATLVARRAETLQ